jgi:hypothetical protein
MKYRVARTNTIKSGTSGINIQGTIAITVTSPAIEIKTKFRASVAHFNSILSILSMSFEKRLRIEPLEFSPKTAE